MGSKLAAGSLPGVCGVGVVDAGEVNAKFNLQNQKKAPFQKFCLCCYSDRFPCVLPVGNNSSS